MCQKDCRVPSDTTHHHQIGVRFYSYGYDLLNRGQIKSHLTMRHQMVSDMSFDT